MDYFAISSWASQNWDDGELNCKYWLLVVSMMYHLSLYYAYFRLRWLARMLTSYLEDRSWNFSEVSKKLWGPTVWPEAVILAPTSCPDRYNFVVILVIKLFIAHFRLESWPGLALEEESRGNYMNLVKYTKLNLGLGGWRLETRNGECICNSVLNTLCVLCWVEYHVWVLSGVELFTSVPFPKMLSAKHRSFLCIRFLLLNCVLCLACRYTGGR